MVTGASKLWKVRTRIMLRGSLETTGPDMRALRRREVLSSIQTSMPAGRPGAALGARPERF
jgi:hypothetical protein